MTMNKLTVLFVALLGAMPDVNGIPTYQICSAGVQGMEITPSPDYGAMHLEMGGGANTPNGSCSVIIGHNPSEMLLMEILSYDENCTDRYLNISIDDSQLDLDERRMSFPCGSSFWYEFAVETSKDIRLTYYITGNSSLDAPELVFLITRYNEESLFRGACADNEFECHNRMCIVKSLQCDGFNNCYDDSDEGPDCNTTSNINDTVCKSSEFQCDNGKCIPASYQCDSTDDCGDNSDEVDCHRTPEPTCDGNQFRCNNGKCVPSSNKCDRTDDCGDYSDEYGCTPISPICPFYNFRCNNGKCVPSSYKCDGTNDCGDYSDEYDCTATTFNFACAFNNEFTCDNGKCLPILYQCDDMDDCGDNSDEYGCSTMSWGTIAGSTTGGTIFFIIIIVLSLTRYRRYRGVIVARRGPTVTGISTDPQHAQARPPPYRPLTPECLSSGDPSKC